MGNWYYLGMPKNVWPLFNTFGPTFFHHCSQKYLYVVMPTHFLTYFAKSTIILTRRGTLEIRVYWYIFSSTWAYNKRTQTLPPSWLCGRIQNFARFGEFDSQISSLLAQIFSLFIQELSWTHRFQAQISSWHYMCVQLDSWKSVPTNLKSMSKTRFLCEKWCSMASVPTWDFQWLFC